MSKTVDLGDEGSLDVTFVLDLEAPCSRGASDISEPWTASYQSELGTFCQVTVRLEARANAPIEDDDVIRLVQAGKPREEDRSLAKEVERRLTDLLPFEASVFSRRAIGEEAWHVRAFVELENYRDLILLAGYLYISYELPARGFPDPSLYRAAVRALEHTLYV